MMFGKVKNIFELKSSPPLKHLEKIEIFASYTHLLRSTSYSIAALDNLATLISEDFFTAPKIRRLSSESNQNKLNLVTPPLKELPWLFHVGGANVLCKHRQAVAELELRNFINIIATNVDFSSQI